MGELVDDVLTVAWMTGTGPPGRGPALDVVVAAAAAVELVDLGALQVGPLLPGGKTVVSLAPGAPVSDPLQLALLTEAARRRARRPLEAYVVVAHSRGWHTWSADDLVRRGVLERWETTVWRLRTGQGYRVFDTGRADALWRRMAVVHRVMTSRGIEAAEARDLHALRLVRLLTPLGWVPDADVEPRRRKEWRRFVTLSDPWAAAVEAVLVQRRQAAAGAVMAGAMTSAAMSS